MTIKHAFINKEAAGKLTVSALGFSALLALSACSSGDNTTADTTPVSEEETTVVEVVEVQEPVVDTDAPEVEVVEAVQEPVTPVEVIDVPKVDADTVEVVAAEPEILAAGTGAKIYEEKCQACHASGLLAAPILGDKAAWAPRLAKGKDTLHLHSAQGFNKMPAQATADVSVAQVHAAVDYMIEASS